MDYLPDCLIQHILSYLKNAKDLARSSCVSKRWKEAVQYTQSLYIPRSSFQNLSRADEIVLKMVSSIVQLEELVVYCPFTNLGLASWLSASANHLKHLELRLDDFNEDPSSYAEGEKRKLDCIYSVPCLESLTLWGVLFDKPPRWGVFENLQNLEVAGAKFRGTALSDALHRCPNLTHLVLVGDGDGEGMLSLFLDMRRLEQCKLDLNGSNDYALSISSNKLISLEVQGCCSIRVPETQSLRHLSIAMNKGMVIMVDFGKLVALESLALRGVQWSWDMLSKMFELAREVKHLFMKVEFTGDVYDRLKPFPEIDLVEFFNSHPKLQKFDIHGAMFAALCHKNGLTNMNSSFLIPCLEEVSITVRSPLNAEQKMGTLESILKHSCNLKKMMIRVLQMKSSDGSADDFFDKVWRFQYMNSKVVSIT